MKINKAISGDSSKKNSKNSFIGLLDIFGFEIFEHNCFEQLCINYANEKLQQHFNNYMFQNEQQEYLKEGLNVDHITFKDNKRCIDLIEKRSSMSPSIFSLLDDFSLLNKNKMNTNPSKLEDELTEKFDISLMNNDHYESLGGFNSKKKGFIVHHFAGKVEYDIKNFLEKNKDSVSPLIESVLANCSNSILSQNFVDHINEGSEPEESKQLRGNSLAFQFKDQLNDLMKTLNVSSPRYVRWIKPNGEKKPKMLESEDVKRQLIWAGILEAIRIRKIGYPIRKVIKDFKRRYKPILTFQELSSLNTNDDVKFCVKILVKINFPNDNTKWQIGTSKVFMKEEVRQLLERELGEALVEYAIIIQRGIRKCLFRKKILRTLACRSISRAFSKQLNINRIRETYATKYWKSKNLIVRNFKKFINNKKGAEQKKTEREEEEKRKINQKMKQMEDERTRLESEHFQYKAELEKLDTNMENTMGDSMRLSENDIFITPGGPGDDDLEEYKYDQDAFREDFDNLSLEMDDDEVSELHQKIEQLDNEVSQLVIIM